jgi:hypothetical protein
MHDRKTFQRDRQSIRLTLLHLPEHTNRLHAQSSHMHGEGHVALGDKFGLSLSPYQQPDGSDRPALNA